MKSRSRSSCLSLVLLVGLCAASILVGGLIYVIPIRAHQAFGPPAKQLGAIERVYLSTRLIMDQNDLVNPGEPQAAARDFVVVSGEPASSTVARLEQQGIIKNSDAFRRYLQYSGLDTSIQAGTYQLSPGMTGLEIARALQNPTPTHVQFRILAGWRLEEIAAALPTSGLEFSPQDFLSAARAPFDDFEFNAKVPPRATLNGFFYPDSYQFPRTITLDEFIKTIIGNFAANITPELQQAYLRQGLDIYQAVTLASMVQREAMSADEMPEIASVFLNRLRANMKLDSDPTVQYALGFNSDQNTWWTNPLSLENLKIASPYNTYLSSGLPPEPISNPNLAALKAVAYPADTPYYYFRAACDGSGRHRFAKTLEEQMGNACP